MDTLRRNQGALVRHRRKVQTKSKGKKTTNHHQPTNQPKLILDQSPSHQKLSRKPLCFTLSSHFYVVGKFSCFVQETLVTSEKQVFIPSWNVPDLIYLDTWRKIWMKVCCIWPQFLKEKKISFHTVELVCVK